MKYSVYELISKYSQFCPKTSENVTISHHLPQLTPIGILLSPPIYAPHLSLGVQYTRQLNVTHLKPRHCAHSRTMPLSLTSVFVAGCCLKLLLFSAYHSTDFEVHRNWMAITYHLPVREWYTNTVSEWTLDYPPFFAYFEWVLSHLCPASVVEDGALDLVAKGSYGMPTIAYQRITVIVSEILLFVACQWYVNSSVEDRQNLNTKGSHAGVTRKLSTIKESKEETEDADSSLSEHPELAATKTKPTAKLRAFAVASSVVLSPGLLIIDHIHFQYNGFMYGIMIASMVAARNGQPLLCGALFAILLCFKHIYLYLAPAYFVYLLRVVVIPGNSFKSLRINFRDTVLLGLIVVGTFTVCFGPFVAFGQLENLKSRLFPFSRGLTHAYWAPNFWALYSFADKVAVTVMKGRGAVSGGTRGIVGDVAFGVLPNVSPSTTFFLTLFYQLLGLGPLLMKPTYARFVGAITYCAYASFLFGWHVHEKAILMIIIPFTFVVLRDKRLLLVFIPLTISGYISLFPLIYTSAEFMVKILYTFAWFCMYFLWFNHRLVSDHRNSITTREFLLDRASFFYQMGFVPVVALSVILDGRPNMEFLGLMIMSVYSAIGVCGSFVAYSWLYMCEPGMWQ
jgi:alpha-1,3-glucosyltransferase